MALSDGSAVPSIFSTLSGTSFTVDTSAVYTTTTYSVKITGTIYTTASDYLTFNVNIKGCSDSDVTFTPATMSDQSYELSS